MTASLIRPLARVVIGSFITASLARTAGAQRLPSYEGAAKAIDGARIRAHMAFLSSDALEGRGTGTRGYDSAAKYVTTQFVLAGLAPCCSGQFAQPVRLMRRDVDAKQTQMTLLDGGGGVRVLHPGADFVLTRPGLAGVRIEGDVVFVGYGVTTGRTEQDDYAGLDVRGKVVAYMPGTPPGLSVDERAFHEDSKVRNAIAHGAIATLRVWTPTEAAAETWPAAVQSYGATGQFTWTEAGDSRSPQREAEQAWLGPEASAALFDGASVSYAQAMDKPAPLSLRTKVRLAVYGKMATAISPNVIGVLRGSDPILSKEFVVVSAHLDHLGIGAPVNGDSIYNGVVDNASGVAALLELARTFSAASQRPKRSLMFIAFAGEEPGDLGSQFFVRHPPVALSSIVADLNIDGISVWPFDGIVPRGAEHSTLSAIIDTLAATAGIVMAAEPVPGRYWIAGSDQYTFMTAGIPAVIVGSARSGPARALALAWTRDRYHAPSDDMAQPLDMGAAARFTQDLMAIVYGIGDAGPRPEWKPGDFFRAFRRL